MLLVFSLLLFRPPALMRHITKDRRLKVRLLQHLGMLPRLLRLSKVHRQMNVAHGRCPSTLFLYCYALLSTVTKLAM
jgi:hypothetical protein